MNEKVVCGEITKTFKHYGHWAMKIPDPSAADFRRSVEKRPFDIVAFVRDYGLAIEVKQIKKWQKFGPAQFEDHQPYYLNKVNDQGGLAYVFLNVRIKDPYENRLIIFEWHKWGPVLTGPGIHRNRLKELNYCQGHKGLFNISTFLKGFYGDGIGN